MCPKELREHIEDKGYTSYVEMYAEIVRKCSLGHARKAAAPSSSPMDLSTIGGEQQAAPPEEAVGPGTEGQWWLAALKGKKGGKGKGKGKDGKGGKGFQCFNCGGWGHRAAECSSKPREQQQQTPQQQQRGG